jgi:hypothetical protein
MNIITDMPQIRLLIGIAQDNPSSYPGEIIDEWISRLDEADYNEEQEDENTSVPLSA